MDSVLVVIFAAFGLIIHQTFVADARPCSCPVGTPQPVCGYDGVTYANACTASCFGVSVTHEGQCRPKLGASRERPSCYCPTISWPVCGKDGSTYSNPCRALCRNVEIASDGPCELQAIRLIRRRRRLTGK